MWEQERMCVRKSESVCVRLILRQRECVRKIECTYVRERERIRVTVYKQTGERLYKRERET